MSPGDIQNFVRTTLLGVLAVGISACGGGGGGGPPPNPTLGTTSFSTIENLPLNGTLTATVPSGGTVTFTQASSPKSGTLSGFTSAGAFVYTPNPSFTGTDSFTVTATDTASHSTTGTVTITVSADQPPVVNNTVLRADTPTNINVLATASSPTKESLTVTVTPGTTPFPASATVTLNSDQTVSVTGLPANFKGLTSFAYTVTDQSGMKTNGTAAIFVGTDPFRAAFVADSGSAGAGSYEVYLTDFAASPVKLSSATKGTVHLQGFAISDNGATVVYRAQDGTNAASSSLSLVQTATPGAPVSVTLPNSAVPVADGSGKDQFVVSPDGKWIAVIAGQGGTSSLYVVQVAATPVVTQVVPTIAGTPAAYATQPTFTSDSKNIYFLATSVAAGANKSLFFTALSASAPPSTPTLASALSDPGTADEVYSYSVSLDQTTIVEQANRAGRVGIFFVAPPHWTTETQINQPPATGYKVTTSTVGLAPGLGGSWSGKQVAYDVGDSSVADSVGGYVANVSTTPNPQLLAPIDQVIGFSPPVGNAGSVYLLYTDGAGLFDINTSGGSPGVQVGNGSQGWYDSSGSVVLVQKLAASGVTLSYNVRPFSSGPTPVTPTGSVAYDVDVSGFGHGAMLFGTASNSGAAPSTVNLELVNALAPKDTLPLSPPSSSYPSPVQLTSYVSKVVQ